MIRTTINARRLAIAGALVAAAIASAGRDGASTLMMFLRRNYAPAYPPVLRQLERDVTGRLNARRDVLALPFGAVTNDDYSFAMTPDALGVIYVVAPTAEFYYVSRPSVNVAFDETTKVRIPTLESPGYATYARSITADGCELYLSSNRDDGPLRAWVATRL